jgi:hypothetical protein
LSFAGNSKTAAGFIGVWFLGDPLDRTVRLAACSVVFASLSVRWFEPIR